MHPVTRSLTTLSLTKCLCRIWQRKNGERICNAIPTQEEVRVATQDEVITAPQEAGDSALEALDAPVEEDIALTQDEPVHTKARKTTILINVPDTIIHQRTINTLQAATTEEDVTADVLPQEEDDTRHQEEAGSAQEAQEEDATNPVEDADADMPILLTLSLLICTMWSNKRLLIQIKKTFQQKTVHQNMNTKNSITGQTIIITPMKKKSHTLSTMSTANTDRIRTEEEFSKAMR